jgi:hypothetical protein
MISNISSNTLLYYGARFHIHLLWCDVGNSEYGRGGHVPAFVAGLATLERGPKTGQLDIANQGIRDG